MSVRLKDNNIVLQDKNGFKKNYTLSEFDTLSYKHPEVIKNNDPSLIWLGWTYIFFGIFILLKYGTKVVREKRILKIITSKEIP